MSACPSVLLSTPGCTTLNGRVLGYPLMDFVFLWHIDRIYIGAVHLLLSWAARLASKKVRPVHWVMLSIHCNLGLPLPHLPSTMLSIRSRCRESCLMMCPKNDSFLIRTLSSNDLLILQIVTPLRLWHVLSILFLAFASVSKASRRCCDIFLMVHV